MTAYVKYLWYVIRHKWFVMIECFKAGLYWRGLTHDLSKFLPSEFIPYAQYFYGGGRSKFAKSGYYKAGFTGDGEFDFAWLLHQKRNRHHWQWWILPEDGGGEKIIPMHEQYWREMICDWQGAGRAQKNGIPTQEWYKTHGYKMRLAFCTRCSVENKLKELADG